MMRFWRARDRNTNEILAQGQLCDPASAALNASKADLAKRYAGDSVALECVDDSGIVVATAATLPARMVPAAPENAPKR